MTLPRERAVVVGAMCLGLAAIGAAPSCSQPPECRRGADCASGACRVDGTCAPAAVADASVSEDGGADGSVVMPIDGGVANPDAGPEDGGTPRCGNADGVVSREEVLFAAGLRATFLIGSGAIETAGQALPDGGRSWDLNGAMNQDHPVKVETLPLAGTWYADLFPGATYASRLADSSELLGVFKATPDALLLVGVVSPTSGLTRTELTYSPPATILSFPLALEDTFTSTSQVSGVAAGFFTSYSERYKSTVDRRGRLTTPFAAFDALRVRVLLNRTLGISLTTQRSFLFVTECFGTVASVRSEPNEAREEFSSASEVRRLAP